MKLIAHAFASLSLFAVGSPVIAGGGAPPQLHNKSVTVAWGESNTWKRLSDGTLGSSTPSHERVFYISSAGRPFVREKGKSGNYGQKVDVGPEMTSGRFTFSGNSMTNYMGREGLRWQITVRFDPSFNSCTTSVIVGKEGAVAKVTGMDGAPYEITGTSVGAATCSIREGNALAG